ncbi:replication initiator protein A [Pseudomonas sp. AB12(2023)]|uniref:replication initiator protein A n=1 Tax=Pseudomonas sp. AB12(2023) TaxID=3048597 RepID=UPI002B231FCA|nr:replication initiator protein A [Pseudomonas sp. AB12(2023)]MEB0222231.1 replication initiator protein A [Pseudomonas sp. AB12(2023)]
MTNPIKGKKPFEQVELFQANMVEWPVKDDLASMEFPIFSLSKNHDTEIREYENATTKKRIRITPSVVGAATVFDKDLLLFIGSQLIEARQSGLPIARKVKVDIYRFLTGTCRSPGGNSYYLVVDMLRRLKGTNLETNIITGGVEQVKGFGLIDDYEIERKTSNGKGALEVNVTISEWLYNALIQYEVLTIDQRYFKLGQALERRLYELARKHTGEKVLWKCDIEILRQKSGSTQDLRRFRSEIRSIIKRDSLPDYRVALDKSAKIQRVVFYTRSNKALTQELQKMVDGFSWFEKLEKTVPV